MRHIAVTFPTGTVGAVDDVIYHESFHLGICDLSLMAADAIILDDLDRWLPGTDYLRFRSQGEDGGMIKSVFGLEEILVGDIVMRHMAVIAVGNLTMGAMCPSEVLRCHQVTVHTGLRIIRQIRGRIGKIQKKNSQPEDNRHYKRGSRPPFFWWDQALRKQKPLKFLR